MSDAVNTTLGAHETADGSEDQVQSKTDERSYGRTDLSDYW